MKKRIKLKGRIKTYIQFCIYLGVLLCVVDGAMFFINVRAGLFLSVYLAAYFAVTLSLYFYNKPIIMNELISFATEYGQIQRTLLREMDLPYALLDRNTENTDPSPGTEATLIYPPSRCRISLARYSPSPTPLSSCL